jgi:phosphatidate cytidylyltransferase
MHVLIDRDLVYVVSGVFVALATATTVGQTLRRCGKSEAHQSAVANLNARIASWWVMCGVILASLLVGRLGSVLLFGLLSFMSLREFITLIPTRRADHRVLLLVFFVGIPVQYVLVATGRYGLFSVLIPLCGALCIPAGSAIGGDTERFIERVAAIQWGLMVCVYAVSHVPALLMLDIPGYAGQNSKLLLYLIIVVESSDVLQYIWGKLRGRRAIAPTVSPSKTVEGLIGGTASATVLGTALWWLTPFRPWQAALLSLGLAMVGFAGGLIMSAVKRDCGVKDFGTALAGHGGVLDRIDSICFAGPVFFHLTRYFFAV